MSNNDALDRYLRQQFGIGLHQVLLAGCIEGHLPAPVAGAVRIESTLVKSEEDDDGSAADIYRGTVDVRGAAYSFALHVYVDREAPTLATDLSEMEPIGWQARMTFAG